MELKDIRVQIDAIDEKLLTLLNARMELVKEVGRIKHASDDKSIYRPEREKEILDRLSKINANSGGALNSEAIEAIFLEIFAVSRNIEKPETVAYLGPEGTFTHQAAESRFGQISEYLPMSTISSVFRAVESKKAKYGVIPIENNIEGIVGESIDLLGKSHLRIVAETSMKISHSLSTRASHLQDIKKIYSKDVAFGQCGEFLRESGLDGVELIWVASTAKAAMLAAEDDESAAICSHIAAKLYNLPIMYEHIEDNTHNETRFVIISDFENTASGNDKTSILARLDNTPGALAKFLSSFENAGINLSKIESRPAKDEGFSYIFYIDFDGHIKDEKIKKALSGFEDKIKWLGSFVKGV
ncbi:MAG TPA: prephenate dehydratase [Campylobacterales bacterium]|nr:prephenate dehydratase [Campylobacterales bacterium]